MSDEAIVRGSDGAAPPTTSRWRVLSDGGRDGAWNMATDEAIAHAVGAGRVPPTIRFYAWERPTVSLGRFQAAHGVVAAEVCERRGIDVVRRPTGGMAVLHDDEITYSICAPLDDTWGRASVAESFRLIGTGLVLGLRRLGVAASLGARDGDPARRRPVACFQSRHLPAIVAEGRKLVGSAQRRWERGMLQHGSLLLRVDVALQRAVFPAWPGGKLDRGVTWLGLLLPEIPARAEVEAALLAGWADALHIRGARGELTDSERREAERLTAARYRNPAWTGRY